MSKKPKNSSLREGLLKSGLTSNLETYVKAVVDIVAKTKEIACGKENTTKQSLPSMD